MAGTASAPTSANAVINTLVFWDEGVSAYEQNDVNLALQKFWKIPDPSAKIFFNIGLMHQRLGNLEAAEKSFEATVFKDQHLAIGHYQLANIYFQEKKHLQAETSYSQSYECLRSKPYIDYKQLGLRYVLYECEILHNLALTSSVLKEKHKALELLDRAVTAAENCKQSKQHIEESRKSVQIGKPADLLELPKEAIFRPPKSKTSNIAKKDYLGKAKVVSAVTEKDDATGFVPVVKENPLLNRPHSPRDFQANTLPSRPPPLQQTSKSLQASPRLLHKPANRPLSTSGVPIPPPPARPPPIPPPPSRPPPLPPSDGPARSLPQGVHDLKIVEPGLSPAGSPNSSPSVNRKFKPPPPSVRPQLSSTPGTISNVSHLGIPSHNSAQMLSSNSPNSSPKPTHKPRQTPTTIPPVPAPRTQNSNDGKGRIPPVPKQPLPPPPPSTYDPSGKASYQSIKWKPNMAASTPTPVSHPAVDIIVKIHFQYTCAIKMKAGTSFADLNEIICKKFEKGSTQLNIWYKNDDHPELLHLNNEFRINDLWSSAKYGRLTLWCYEREGEEKQRDEKQVIALYDFAGQQSCDLSFKQGNVLSEVISIDDDWYQGQLHGKTGLFPKNYVKDLDLPLPSPMDSKAAPKPAGNASGVTRTGSSVRTKSNQSQKKPAEETPTSFGALMMELKTAAQRRSVYVDGDKNDKA
ncbi:neutrophil cytosol factor 2-like isoform X2 [Ptychodera flava]|uniref:neutrophil cytosol factor 2-like isoform X2 n=1 Tax=Ptychodera flava TaxID=63121 RepID=UPI00396A182B